MAELPNICIRGTWRSESKDLFDLNDYIRL
jgi:hypothetical protein